MTNRNSFDWNVFRSVRGGMDALRAFANGSTSLNRMRKQFRTEPEVLSTVYRMERVGVDAIRPRVRRAVARS